MYSWVLVFSRYFFYIFVQSYTTDVIKSGNLVGFGDFFVSFQKLKEIFKLLGHSITHSYLYFKWQNWFFLKNKMAPLKWILTQIVMHIAYVMTENDDKQMRSYDSFFPALKNLHISTPNSFSRGSGGYENLQGTYIKFNLLSRPNEWHAENFVLHIFKPSRII